MSDGVLNQWMKCTWASSSGLVLLFVLACGARVEGQPQESNTNWLQACVDRKQCGQDLECACGVCTQGCNERACPSRLVCLGENECQSDQGASCQATCTSASDCNALSPNLRCERGVCVDDVGLTTSQVSSGTNPGSNDVTCRLAYVEYPVGERVARDGCSNTDVCTCGPDGEWMECGGFRVECPWAGAVRPCSEMFPGVELEDLPSDPLTVESASVDGTDLVVNVSYGGGCTDHDVAVCFAPGGEAYPVNVELKLIHDAHEDTCEALESATLEFDLTPVTLAHSEAYMTTADLINTPFGVIGFGELSCEQRETASQVELARVAVEGAACDDNFDCALESNSTGCHASCGVITSLGVGALLRAQIDEINAEFCATYEDDCGPLIRPPCDSPGMPFCIDGRCTEIYPVSPED